VGQSVTSMMSFDSLDVVLRDIDREGNIMHIIIVPRDVLSLKRGRFSVMLKRVKGVVKLGHTNP